MLRSSFRGQRLNRFNVGVSVTAGFLNQLVGSVLYLSALGLASVAAYPWWLLPSCPSAFLSIPLLCERPTKKAIIGAVLMFFGVIITML